jgi:hypothetical protein
MLKDLLNSTIWKQSSLLHPNTNTYQLDFLPSLALSLNARIFFHLLLSICHLQGLFNLVISGPILLKLAPMLRLHIKWEIHLASQELSLDRDLYVFRNSLMEFQNPKLLTYSNSESKAFLDFLKDFGLWLS